MGNVGKIWLRFETFSAECIQNQNPTFKVRYLVLSSTNWFKIEDEKHDHNLQQDSLLCLYVSIHVLRNRCIYIKNKIKVNMETWCWEGQTEGITLFAKSKDTVCMESPTQTATKMLVLQWKISTQQSVWLYGADDSD